ncbi:MAG: TylF/MycF/NovP-related O-methyltransferase [Candidatus Altiarchaeota archaeon]
MGCLLRKVKYFRDEDIDEDGGFAEVYGKCRDYTLTSKERMYALYKAVRYVVDAKIPGDFVECGLWRGGSSMLMAYSLMGCADAGRKLYLYDTFAGMPEPTVKDVALDGSDAMGTWRRKGGNGGSRWGYVSQEEVEANLKSTGYPASGLVFVKGMVEDTMPATLPSRVALLRLDTDFFDSTRHELIHMYPLLSQRGVLIVDDYGYWRGARAAVDGYFKENNVKMLLDRVDYTGRIGVKTSA